MSAKVELNYLSTDILSIYLLTYLSFLGLFPSIWKFPGEGVELELQLLACTTARAMPDPVPVCDLHHSSQQHQILNLLGGAGDQTSVLMDTSQAHYP